MKPQDSKPDPVGEPVVVEGGTAAAAAGAGGLSAAGPAGGGAPAGSAAGGGAGLAGTAAGAAAAADGVGDTATPDRDDWRGAQDNPWQPDEEAPPPVIGQ